MSEFAIEQLAVAEQVYDLVGPPRQRYCPIELTAKQEVFALLHAREALFGGAAGCGKSVTLLMTALMYADVPGYAALLLRPSVSEFSLPGGLLELAADWLTPTKATWIADQKTWRFPGPGPTGTGGATLTFGYLDGPGDLGRYYGSSFSYLGFDELTRFTELQYRRMHRVLRQPQQAAGAFPAAPDGTRLSDVPLRVRATAQPRRHPATSSSRTTSSTRTADPTGAVFIRAWLEDNPHLDTNDYIAPSTPCQAPNGNDSSAATGTSRRRRTLPRDWFPIIEPNQCPDTSRGIRYWDLAATEPNLSHPDPDYTVGAPPRHRRPHRHLLPRRHRPHPQTPGTIQEIVAATAQLDGHTVDDHHRTRTRRLRRAKSSTT